jgi:hypothetical protein
VAWSLHNQQVVVAADHRREQVEYLGEQAPLHQWVVQVSQAPLHQWVVQVSQADRRVALCHNHVGVGLENLA